MCIVQDGSTALSIAMDEGHRDIGVLLYAHMNTGRHSSPVCHSRVVVDTILGTSQSRAVVDAVHRYVTVARSLMPFSVRDSRAVIDGILLSLNCPRTDISHC